MFYKIAFLLVFLLGTSVLTGCLSNPSTGSSQAKDQEQQVSYETRSGVIKKLGETIYDQGTHRLEEAGKLIALLESKGSKLDLDKYIGEEVDVQGIISKTKEGNLDFIQVVAVTPKNKKGQQSIENQSFSDTEFGYSVEYPSIFTARENRQGVAFRDVADKKIVEITILENKLQQDLTAYLIDNYGYAADQLTKVSVAGITGYRFQNTTGSVIYLGEGKRIFALAWFDIDTDKRARNRRYYLEIVQSFKLTSLSGGEVTGLARAGRGEFCGGVAAIRCATGLTCRSDAGFPDAGGTCMSAETVAGSDGMVAIVAKDSPENNALPPVSETELFRGWYYGDQAGKKSNTPADWILVDSGTRFSMWRRPDTLPEVEPVLSAANLKAGALSTDRRKVFNYIQDNITTLAPEKPKVGSWSVVQEAFAAPNYVYTIYRSSEQTRRLLFVYTIVDPEITLEALAYFRPGTRRDWITTEGVDSAFSKALTIVDAGGEVTAEIVAGMRAYKNRHVGYSLQYPKDWYWQNLKEGQKTEFSESPFPRGITRITVEVVPGTEYYFDELSAEGNLRTVYARLDTKSSIKISGDKKYAEEIQKMVLTFKKD